MAMQSPDKNTIDQMRAFILQEAREKAHELAVKTENDFNLEKQNLVHDGKLRINQEFDQKNRDREVQQRIDRSTAITTCRANKMQERAKLVSDLKTEAITQVMRLAKTGEYDNIVKNLILQAFAKLHTADGVMQMTIFCRNVDKKIVKKQLAEATKPGVFPKPVEASLSELDLPENIIPGQPSGPGVVVTSQQGAIVCDNTLGSRLDICFAECQPQLRSVLNF